MAPSGQLTAPAVQALLADATLGGEWALGGARSTIGLRSRSIWGLAPVKGVFGQVTGHGTVSPALADNFAQTTHPPTPRSGTSMEEAMNSAPAIGESDE
jgi:hypothetical protein